MTKPVSPPQEFVWLRSKVNDLIERAHFKSESGISMYYPACGGEMYPCCYLRDYTYMVESAPEFIPADQTRSIIELFLNNCREDGLCPETILPNGDPSYICHGNRPAADNGMFLVKLFKAYFDQTEDRVLLGKYFGRLHACLSAVPTDSKTGLVWIDPASPHTGYGFTDTIAKTGYELYCSLLLYESHSILSGFSQLLDRPLDVTESKSQMDAIKRHLDLLYSEQDGVFYAASHDCRQIDVWGSLYACVVGAVNSDRASRIGDWFEANRDSVLCRGHLRHLPEPEYWNRIIVADNLTEHTKPGRFQNGPYWSTPTGWYAELLESRQPGSGLQLLKTLVHEFQENSIWECIGPDGYRRLENNISSAVLPYKTYKALLSRVRQTC
jgi:hypothetical protein